MENSGWKNSEWKNSEWKGRYIAVLLRKWVFLNDNKYTNKSLPGRVSVTKKVHDLSGEVPRYACCRGSFTLEAAVILPLLACFFVSILFFFRVMQVQMEVQKTLDDTGRKLAVYLPNVEESFVDEAAGLAAAEVMFRSAMEERETAKQYISGGTAGISLLGSTFEGDEVCLRAVYQMKLPVRLLQVSGLRLMSRTECRKWTGFQASGEAETEVWVYITENGTVYHTTETCTYLNLSIRGVNQEEMTELYNENGRKYTACELCGENGNERGRLYVTNYGDRYHTTLGCSGLKRTILTVRLSEVEGRPPCSKCGSGTGQEE